jgi:hypothetical protein
LSYTRRKLGERSALGGGPVLPHHPNIGSCERVGAVQRAQWGTAGGYRVRAASAVSAAESRAQSAVRERSERSAGFTGSYLANLVSSQLHWTNPRSPHKNRLLLGGALP